MTYPLPTDTRHTNLETRQYDVFGMDLGEGIPRSAIKVAALLFTPWLLLLLVLDAPFMTGVWPTVWISPPLVATWLLTSRDGSGRVRLRGARDAVVFWVIRSHRASIVNAGTTTPTEPGPIFTDAQYVVLPSTVSEISA